MIRLLRLAFLLLALAASAQAADPLRIFIRAGAKTHGPGQHDHPRFLQEWTKLLTERGAQVDGGMSWPTAEQFAKTDVVIVFAPDPWDCGSDDRREIDKFAARGGGFVVLHDAVCSRKDPDWVRSLLGGAWRYGKAKWFEGDISFYYVNNTDPITAGASNFDVRDEMYYQLDMDPAAKVLAATWTPDARANKNGRAFPHIYEEAPMIWTFEHKRSRAYTNLLGHEYATFGLPQVRAVLLRGIAWAGKREKIDELCVKEELDSLRYPPGGPTPPAAAPKKLSVHPEFKATLVAAEPLINKPIAIDWDARGRMWVAETVEYPNGRRGMRDDLSGAEWIDHGGLDSKPGVQNRAAQDRISILTDSKGDGVMDKKDVFFDGLELVTGFVFHRDGVIASAAPDIFFLRDTDGDGKADKIEKLYTGLGIVDTHAVINNLRWGPDGWIYATHGYSGSDHVKSGDGKRDFGRIGSGVVRFKPDGSAFEQYSSKGGNTWGLAITTNNDIFWTQPTSGDLIMQTLLPESVLAHGRLAGTTSFQVINKSPRSFPMMTWEQQAYRQIDFVGSFTAAAGCAIYDGGTWPARWNNNYFCTEPTINIVHHEVLDPAGVGYTSHKEADRDETEFIRSGDLWFRPIEVRVGPDGALYVLDFYNQAVIHNDTRGPLHNNVHAAVRPDRDHYFGRIWRVDHRDAPKVKPADFSNATEADLVAGLKSINRPVRFTAQRLLTEANSETANQALQGLVLDEKAAAAARVQALWTLAGKAALDDATLDALLGSTKKDAATLERAALKILADRPALASRHLPQIIPLASTGFAPVRLAALLALGAAEPRPETSKALAALLPTLDDKYLQAAALAAATRSPGAFLREALAGVSSGPASPLLLSFMPPVCASLNTDTRAAEDIVLLLSEKPAVDLKLGASILSGLAEIKRPAVVENPREAQVQEALRRLLNRSEPEAAAALPLAVAWNTNGALAKDMQALVPKLIAKLNAPEQSDEALAIVITNLLGARQLSSDIMPAIGNLLGAGPSPALQERAIKALGETISPASAEMLLAHYAQLAPALQDAAFSQLLKRKEWTKALIGALKSGRVSLESLGVLELDKLRHYADPETAREASDAIDQIRGPLTQKKDELIASLLPVVEQGGDAEKGKALFTTACAVCHKFNKQGSTLAPDLSGMGAHPRGELLTHILDPNREVDPTFAAFAFQTKRGVLYQGIITTENAKSVHVRDAAGEHDLLKSDLASRQELGRSLMPEGFEALGAESLRDIIAYLQATDARFRVIDLHGVFTADSRRGIFLSEENENETLKFRKFGNVKVGDIPFVIADPVNARGGKNLLVLRGGSGLAKRYPQKVEIPVDKVQASTLDILGGIGGWAFPCCGDEKGEGISVAKITVQYAGGKSEELVLRNGVEISDYVRPHDVPGSKLAPDLVNGQQVRIIRKKLAHPGVIEKLTLESYDNRVAPVFVAITAETEETPPAAVSAR
jgi:putative membrane-bound dehydrogenase-like protein